MGNQLTRFISRIGFVMAMLITTPAQAEGVTVQIIVSDDHVAAKAPSSRDNGALLEMLRRTAPVTDQGELQRRIKIPDERIREIKVGEQARSAVLGYVAATGSTTDDGFDCTDFNCSCVGDEACNNMFSTVCASPSTNGSCHNGDDPDGVICGCNPNFPPFD